MTEKELKKLEAKVKWCADYLEIEKLQSKYSHYHHCCMFDMIPTLFAKKTEGIEIEIEGSGVFEGLTAPRRMFFERMGRGKSGPSPLYPGWLGLHMTMNPVIEINKDGTRAKGLWHSNGVVVCKHDDKLVATWALGKYVMEYVKEDGEWKILKLNYRQTFMCPYDKSWLEEPSVPVFLTNGKPPARLPADKPTTYHKPYSPDRLNVIEPPPPEPYED
jgi:hypothetical protein